MESDLVPYTACTVLPAQSVLVLAPHPDDEVFGCGGAILAHVRAGVPVGIVILTDGALYGDAELRKCESVAAAKLLGYGVPEFWNYLDRGLVYSDALVQRLVEKIAACAADLVYVPSPWEVHPDHRQTCQLGVDAVRLSAPGVRLVFYEVGMPLWPNVLLDITTIVAPKEAAMRCFKSQLMQQDYVVHLQALNQYRSYTLGPDVLAAEAFWLASPQELDHVLQGSVASLLATGTLHSQRLAVEAHLPVVHIGHRVFFYQRLNSWLAKVLSWRSNRHKVPMKDV